MLKLSEYLVLPSLRSKLIRPEDEKTLQQTPPKRGDATRCLAIPFEPETQLTTLLNLANPGRTKPSQVSPSHPPFIGRRSTFVFRESFLVEVVHKIVD